jgi:hypothetical protein
MLVAKPRDLWRKCNITPESRSLNPKVIVQAAPSCYFNDVKEGDTITPIVIEIDRGIPNPDGRLL